MTRVAVAADEPAPLIAERIEAHTFSPLPAIALLLVGYPEPLGEIVRELARRHLIDGGLELSDPAGRAIFPEWWDTVGAHGAGVPYLSYELPLPVRGACASSPRVEVAAGAEVDGAVEAVGVCR